MKPQEHKTSCTLTADTYVQLQSLMAQRQDLTMSDVMNLAIQFYYRHADNPELDAMTAHLSTISKRLDDLLTRSTPTLDPDLLAQAIVTQLDARTPPEATPAPVTPEPTTPTPATQKPRWAARFGKRFGKPPPDHW